jgi:accessory colonization factor AcfC
LDKILQFLNKNKSEIIVDQQFSSNKNLLEKIKKNKNLKISYKDIDKNLLTTKEDEQKYFLTFYSQIVNDENFLLIAKSDEQIFCQALVIAGDNMQNAREFLKFLKSDQAKSVIKASGFFVD